jgi:ATP-binding cassette subfamily F protein 3
LLSRPNLLLLDEPTNHLDIATREGLIAALEEFDGTILVASHDRYLLDRITNRILEVAGGKAATYPGNYSEYHRSKSKLLDSPDEALLPKQTRGTASGMGNGRTSPATTRTRPGSKSGGAAASHSPERTGSGKAAPPAAAPPVKLSPARLERQIQELETRLSSLTERMNDPDLYKSADMLTVVEEYDRVRARLESLYEDWTAVSG